ncbi:hypothetical protein GDO86_010136 [Hymenochirus boettgeri]|uniref:Uncharacterized protein n=1 Tax=Hymenochirus boettgeri TaxID=247094 RepID=A0A8T2JN91_9PIPI|nr:hypothetical protein GDO86_010136 [Hymenochirus boettgeri]
MLDICLAAEMGEGCQLKCILLLCTAFLMYTGTVYFSENRIGKVAHCKEFSLGDKPHLLIFPMTDIASSQKTTMDEARIWAHHSFAGGPSDS